MIDWVSTKTDEVTELFRGVSVLGAIIMVAVAYYKTRTIVALIVAAITAGVFLWTINNTDWWQERVREESEIEALRIAADPSETAAPGFGLLTSTDTHVIHIG